LELCITFLPER